MEDSIKAKLSGILSNFGGKASAVSNLLSSEEGKKLVNSLSDSDKKAIMEKFMSMDEKQVSEKLKNVDASVLKNMTADDIKKKLR